MSKTILITGGSSGIGKSVGEYLQDKGFRVYGTSRNPERYSNSKIPLIKMDVTNSDSIAIGVSSVINKAGRIDVLINNAGAGITGPMEEIPEEAMKQILTLIFLALLMLLKLYYLLCVNKRQG